MAQVAIKDEFFTKQPNTDFVNELKTPIHSKKPTFFGKRKICDGEIDLSGMYLKTKFPDDGGILDTAYADFETFLRVYGIGGGVYPISIVKAETSCFEEYSVNVAENGCVIKSADTEGVRRALVRLEDMLVSAEAPFLTPCAETRRPIIKSRITRGFFSPTNRPPKNIDELWDDVDYYPDEYLNRLAHDGNNGIWIYTHFADLLKSSVIEEYGKDSQKRIEKLKKVVDKCARYGIKVYIFAVEPWGLAPELREKYPELLGPPGFDRPTFCTHSPQGAQYCIEATESLFRQVPRLGGFINITMGERVTNCSNALEYEKCPRCGKYKKGEVLSYTADLFKEGIRRAGADAEFISWTYGHRIWEYDDIRDYVRSAPDDVMLMQNFDDYGFEEQLGKTRMAIDYWLSYVGPSEMFEETAKCANANNKHLYAKMQVCCSHELATVPYIPVPALIFRKYAAAHKYNVEGILQCWYFGNYPSIMSKAAGELSFTEDFTDEDAFLKRLAGICYGKSNAEDVAAAWKLFSEGYSNYPINIMFSYYGPMHDGVVWELQLFPKNRSLSRTWLLVDKPDGDRICEALENGHTLDEVTELSKRICEKWQQGLKLLPKDAVGEMADLAEALGVLFDSGKNILEFYGMRERLGMRRGDPRELLDKMRGIVNAEIINSKKMIELCNADSRLGYHSEAEGFKFFPEKLRHRIETLEALLETEFAAVEERIARGMAPLGFYEAEGEDVYCISKDSASSAFQKVDADCGFKASYDKSNVYLDIKCDADAEIVISFEGVLLCPTCELIVKDSKLCYDYNIGQYRQLYGDLYDKEYSNYKIEKTAEGCRIAASREHIGWTDDKRPFRLMIKIDGKPWIKEENPVYTLGKHYYSPGEFGFIAADNAK